MDAWQKQPQLTKMWKTKGSRYKAHARLIARNNWTLYSISLASAALITVSVVPYMRSFGASELQKDLLTIASIFLSISISAISLIEGARNQTAKAEALYLNAREISGILSDAQHIVDSGSDNISSYLKDYENKVSSCPYNHDDIDFRMFVLDNRAFFDSDIAKSRFYVAFARMRYFFDVYGLFLIMLISIVPPITAIIFFL